VSSVSAKTAKKTAEVINYVFFICRNNKIGKIITIDIAIAVISVNIKEKYKYNYFNLIIF